MFEIDRLEQLIRASIVLEIALAAIILSVWIAGL